MPKLIIIVFMLYMFSANLAQAEKGNAAEKISKAIDDYSSLIDIAVSDEPVYDYELSDSKNNLLRILSEENDKNKVADIAGRLLDSTHKYKDEKWLGKPVKFTIMYGCDFLAKLGTEASYDRLLDEYEYWDNQSIKNSMYYLIIRVYKKNISAFDRERFTRLQCGDANDPAACKKAENALKKTDKPAKGIILNGGAKICC